MPRTQSQRPRSRSPQRPRQTARSTVLIVEDAPDLRVLAESNISDFGYMTLSAANGREALALIEEHQDIKILFTDINLPDETTEAVVDGLELARRAVELRPDLGVIYTTGGIPTDGMNVLFVQNSILLRKPYTRSELREAIQSMADAGS